MSRLNLKNALKGALLSCAVLASSIASADIVIGSWNLKRLGHGDGHSYPALASVASQADLLAVQEVMTEQGLSKLEQALEKHTGESWSTLASHAIGSRSYKELYAFVWRDKAVAYEEGAVVYLDRGNRFIREPYSAKFRSLRTGTTLALGNVHILYGKGVSDRTPEIRALADYWEWMAEVYPGTPRVLAGDFNLPPSDAAWAPLKQQAQPLITRGASTLSSANGRYANLYDNLWFEQNSGLTVARAGIVDYPRMLGWNHEKSRRHVSDHAPVFAALGRAQLNVPLVGGAQASTSAARSHPAPTALARESLSPAGAVRGNSNSQIYHKPGCPSYGRISAKNQVEFPSSQAAEAAGYRLAGNCR